MFSIYRSKKPKHDSDLRWLEVDMHSHLLPGIDDGCPDTETSLECIAGLQEIGLSHFFTTPHIYSEIHPNDRDSIRAAQAKLNDALRADRSERFTHLARRGVYAAAEYMLDDESARQFQAAASGEIELMALPGRQVLVEMSYQFERKDVLDQLFNLQLAGYTPILAHPERYVYYHDDPKAYARFRERGCKLQLNLLSLGGYYGEGVRKMAQNLVKEGMIAYVGTDLHHTKHLEALRQMLKQIDLQKLLKPNALLNAQLAREAAGS